MITDVVRSLIPEREDIHIFRKSQAQSTQETEHHQDDTRTMDGMSPMGRSPVGVLGTRKQIRVCICAGQVTVRSTSFTRSVYSCLPFSEMRDHFVDTNARFGLERASIAVQLFLKLLQQLLRVFEGLLCEALSCSRRWLLSTVVGLSETHTVSNSAELRSFLLTICMLAPESTTNSLSSGFFVDAACKIYSSGGEQNVAFSFL